MSEEKKSRKEGVARSTVLYRLNAIIDKVLSTPLLLYLNNKHSNKKSFRLPFRALHRDLFSISFNTSYLGALLFSLSSTLEWDGSGRIRFQGKLRRLILYHLLLTRHRYVFSYTFRVCLTRS